MDTYLPPVERPSSPFWRLGFYFMRRKYGKVMTPASVFSVRMPTAFTMFYGKVGKLDKKLTLPAATVSLLREQVASTNGCAFCMDANKAAVMERSPGDVAKLDALDGYQSSAQFSPAEQAALDYATELTTRRAVSDATFARLSAHWSEREICDIVWVVASEHIYNITNLGLNIGSDGYCEILAKR